MTDYRSETKVILQEVHSLGFDDLRYSVFSSERKREWEIRIDFNDETQRYEVYATLDRASITGKESFKNFKEAKNRFIEMLKNKVELNRFYVEEGMAVEYPSPLWDN